MAATSAEENQTKIVRRNRPGTRADDMYAWPEQDFNDMETVLAGRPIFLVAVCFASLTTGHHFRMTMVLPIYEASRLFDCTVVLQQAYQVRCG